MICKKNLHQLDLFKKKKNHHPPSKPCPSRQDLELLELTGDLALEAEDVEGLEALGTPTPLRGHRSQAFFGWELGVF